MPTRIQFMTKTSEVSKTAEISETIVNDAAGQKKFYFWNGIFKAEQ